MPAPQSEIWLVNQYATSGINGDEGRHTCLSAELSKLGYAVTLIRSSASHLSPYFVRKLKLSGIRDQGIYSCLDIPLVQYETARGIKRVASWFQFAIKIPFVKKKYGLNRPAYIIYSSPSPIGFLGAMVASKLHSARLIYEVRDIWPLTLIKIGGVSKFNPLVLLMAQIEKLACVRSSAVISNLKGAESHFSTKGLEEGKFEWIPNGIATVDFDNFDIDRESGCSYDSDRKIFVVGYTGTVGVANALDVVIDAAEKLCRLNVRGRKIVFRVLGSGSEKAKLERRVSEHGLDNVEFYEKIPKDQVRFFLDDCNICLISWLNSELYEFGVAANKYFDYFYSSKPVISCYSGRYDPVQEFDCGFSIPAGDSDALVQAVLKASQMPDGELENLGSNGRKAISAIHNYKSAALKLHNLLVKLE